MNGKKSTAGNSVLSVFTGNTGIIGVLVILCVVVALATDKFLTPSNIISVLRQISINTYIALGMTLIIILGHIDLAVGAIVAMSGTLTVGFVVNQGLPIGVAIAAGIIIGVVAGLIDGMVVSKFRVPAFIITMAMMNVCNGIAYVYSGGQSTRITDKFFIAIGTGYLFNIIPLPVVYMIILIIVFSFLLSKTKFGTYVYAIGGNREAARLSGVPIKKVEIIVFTLSGALAAFAGLVLASRMYSGQPSVGSGYEMDAIAACVLGGTSMAGGRGRISGTVFGARNPRLHTDEVLIALSICAVNEPKAALALKQLEKLKCCEVHSTVILSSVDENVFKKLGINLTCEARYETKKLFHRN